jgi:hypothetical protein
MIIVPAADHMLSKRQFAASLAASLSTQPQPQRPNIIL